MRRLFVLFMILFLFVFPAFSSDETPEESSSDNDILVVTAYKNPPMPENLQSLVHITNYTGHAITGTTESFEIDYSQIDQKRSNALQISVSTNKYDDIFFDIYFYPFVNKHDSSDFYTVKYTVSNQSQNEVITNEGNYYYKYKAKWVYTSGLTKNGNTYYVNVTTGSYSLVQIRSTLTALRKTESSNWSNYSLTGKTGGIPYIGDQLVNNIIKFDLNIDRREVTPEPNVEYEAKIRVVISAF